MAAKKANQPDTVSFDAIYELLSDFVDLEDADEIQPSSAQTVYRSSVVLWMLILQRQQKGCSLKDAVKHLLDVRPQWLPKNKRLDEQKLSTSTAAYSAGRKRLSLDTVMWLVNKVQQSLVDLTAPTFEDKRVFAFDGTTLALAPEQDLYEAYPPATNQYGESPWPMAHLVVAHEVASGAALAPEIGAMYGEEAVSETRLIHQHLANIPGGSVILADAAYGITSVAHAIDQAGHQFVLRMKKNRWERVRRTGDPQPGEGPTSWVVNWTPSARELRANPELPSDFCLPVRLHELESDQGETLYLVTNLPHKAKEIGDLYAQRWSIETNISELKIALDTEQTRAKSKSMFLKELMTSMVAYNLTIEFRRQAAKQANVKPRRLSFTGVWGVFRIFLLKGNITTAQQWQDRYEYALTLAAKEKLPNRKGRSEPRMAYKKRGKSTHFKKRNPPWNKS